MESASGATPRKRAPTSTGISSVVSTRAATPPPESGTMRTDASAMNGWARSTRSDSARRNSVHGRPTWSAMKASTTRSRVVA